MSMLASTGVRVRSRSKHIPRCVIKSRCSQSLGPVQLWTVCDLKEVIKWDHKTTPLILVPR